MSDQYLGEIKMFAGGFAPQGWAICDGSELEIASQPDLYRLIGTTYGGDGQTTFALPDLRSRVPVHQGTLTTGSYYPLGQAEGVETVTLSLAQVPTHTHDVACNNNNGEFPSPADHFWARGDNNQFSSQGAEASMNAATITGFAGGQQPHDNMLPYQAINFIIALVGVWPPQG